MILIKFLDLHFTNRHNNLMKLHNYGEEFLDLIKDIAPLSLTQKTFEAGVTIYSQGDMPNSIYYIRKGLVGLTSISLNGSESLLRVFGKGFLFGHRALISDDIYHANSHTLCKTQVYLISKEEFNKLISSNPKAAILIAKILANELRRSELRLRDMSGKKVMGRIIEAIIFLKGRYPDYQWTRREIGEFSGAKTETVSRAITKLQELGHLYKEGRSLHIKDPIELISLVDEDF